MQHFHHHLQQCGHLAYDLADIIPRRIFLSRPPRPRLPLLETLPETIAPDVRKTPSLDRTKPQTSNAVRR